MKHPMQCAKCFRVCRLSDSGKTWVCTICKHREKANGGQAVSDEQITAEATPAGELRRQILSQCVAKNEREWWAARTIEKLEFELNAANDRIKRLEEFVDQLTNPKFTRDDLPKEALLQRIKRLEEAGNGLLWYFCPKNTGDISFLQSEAIRQWNKAKEANP